MIAEYLAYLQKIWDVLANFGSLPFYAKTEPGWHFILRVFLIAAFFLGSAFLAATIAELRKHKMKLHFLLGLLVPWIYPLVLFFILNDKEDEVEEVQFDPRKALSSSMTDRLKDIRAEQDAERNKNLKSVQPEELTVESEVADAVEDLVEEEPETAEPVPAEPEAEEIDETAEPPEAGKSIFTQRFFESMVVDSSGAKAGPFKMVVENGTEFTVGSIKNIQSDLASFEIEVKGKIKNIRIRYDNIVSFEKI